MKTSLKRTLWLTGIAVATGFLIPSCVVPYDDDDAVTTHSVTTYSPGYVTSSLPDGYRTEIIDGTSYYIAGDTYYRPYSNWPGSYVVVEPPRIHRTASYQRDIITDLPPGYRTIRHGGSVYYQSRNSYYQRRGSGYVVVPSPF